MVGWCGEVYGEMESHAVGGIARRKAVKNVDEVEPNLRII